MMIKVVSLLLYLCLAPFAGALLDGVDRKITARMQGRKGPKLLQPFYDLIKLFSKQMIAVNSVQLLLNLSYLAFLAITGGIFKECYNIMGGIDTVIPVDVYVPGCAARPQSIIDGVLQAVEILEKKKEGGQDE